MSYILRENAICFFSFSKEYTDPFSLESDFGFASIHCTANVVGGCFASWKTYSVGSSLCRFSVFKTLGTIYLFDGRKHIQLVRFMEISVFKRQNTYVTALL